MKKIYLYRFLYVVFWIPIAGLQIIWTLATLPLSTIALLILAILGYIIYGDCDKYEPVDVFYRISLIIIQYYTGINDKIKELEYKLKKQKL